MLRPLSSGFNKSWGSKAGIPSLRTAAVKPPAPANNSKNSNLSSLAERPEGGPLAAGRSRSPQAGASPRGGEGAKDPDPIPLLTMGDLPSGNSGGMPCLHARDVHATGLKEKVLVGVHTKLLGPSPASLNPSHLLGSMGFQLG